MARLTPERRAELEAWSREHWTHMGASTIAYVQKRVADLLADLTDAEIEIARLRALVPAGTIEEGR